MIQIRWVKRTRIVKRLSEPCDAVEKYKVLQYRQAENPQSEHELHGIAWSTWMDVPEESEE